ncbi:hypothetical protein MOMA_02110 [Moraxella macacae 0408225]|uniref:Imelysin-like domain-containing protein n=1 Tax=Moraxella macacae 0408225 TaxID=1230338 RepID=L2F9M2_9GAMM|nr:imelysin family protein [Moraxella macacae]ELA09163.1 hypothetical protein MOMA_02110 [Moraxella macacae 0408225]
MKPTKLTPLAAAFVVAATAFASFSPTHAHTAAKTANQTSVAQGFSQTANKDMQQNGKQFLQNYSNLAQKSYAASLADAKALQIAINQFAKNPTAKTLENAKQAWLKSRESYGMTEIFRLSQGPIDAEEGWVEETYGNLEGQINAWPLDEHMIDYTIDADGKRTAGNIIDGTGLFTPAGDDAKAVDITHITPDVLTELNENGGEANVTTGYHAIEFLLWGQDQDYNNFVADTVTHGAMTAGQRPLSDFTTDKYAKRRLQYLTATAQKLVDDLATVTSAWQKNGLYYQALNRQLTGKHADKNIEQEAALKDIFAGMGVFLKSELANERIAVAVLTPSEEDEHSCFSDNTHRDIMQNFEGFKNIVYGSYQGKKQDKMPLINTLNPTDKAEIDKMVASIDKRIAKIDQLAKTSMHFDYQVQPQNTAEVLNIVSLKNELRRLGDKMIDVAKTYRINLTTDDVTDQEETKIEG